MLIGRPFLVIHPYNSILLDKFEGMWLQVVMHVWDVQLHPLLEIMNSCDYNYIWVGFKGLFCCILGICQISMLGVVSCMLVHGSYQVVSKCFYALSTLIHIIDVHMCMANCKQLTFTYT